jgi:signal recognition particle receptor subunit beta
MNVASDQSPEKASLPLYQIKIIYWGPGESGKTTNFQRLKEIYRKKQISHGFSIETTTHRTLWNDAVSFQFTLEKLRVEVIVHVATTTGQERFLSTREYILQNADGVIFIADSAPNKQADNLRSFEELVAFTRVNKIPILIQLNKRDLPNAVSVVEFRKRMNLPMDQQDKLGFQIVYEAHATDRQHPVGVEEIFVDMLFRILITKKYFTK